MDMVFFWGHGLIPYFQKDLIARPLLEKGEIEEKESYIEFRQVQAKYRAKDLIFRWNIPPGHRLFS